MLLFILNTFRSKWFGMRNFFTRFYRRCSISFGFRKLRYFLLFLLILGIIELPKWHSILEMFVLLLNRISIFFLETCKRSTKTSHRPFSFIVWLSSIACFRCKTSFKNNIFFTFFNSILSHKISRIHTHRIIWSSIEMNQIFFSFK